MRVAFGVPNSNLLVATLRTTTLFLDRVKRTEAPTPCRKLNVETAL